MARIESALRLFGVDLRRMAEALRELPAYFRESRRYRAELKRSGEPFAWGKLYPCVGEKGAASGSARGHYFHQDLLVARRVFEREPTRHIDVGSRVDGFVAHVASFREIEVVDIRPVDSTVPGIRHLQCDLAGTLPVELRSSADSVSCLHALEHFGLARYGDILDVAGYRRGLENLTRMVSPEGWLYLSVPIGRQRVEFNAHRVFDCKFVMELVPSDFELRTLSYVDDIGDLHENVACTPEALSSNFGCVYGCGIFEFKRHAVGSREGGASAQAEG